MYLPYFAKQERSCRGTARKHSDFLPKTVILLKKRRKRLELFQITAVKSALQNR